MKVTHALFYKQFVDSSIRRIDMREAQAKFNKLKEDVPRQYKRLVDDWLEDSTEWYHALIAYEDLPILVHIPHLQIYAWCFCKVVASDGSEAHNHWHGLVHFKNNQKLSSWRRKAKCSKRYFKSRKNTFKKITCLDHVVGVLRYISCKSGQKVGRRDQDGLVSHPHVHYKRQPIDSEHRHDVRNAQCGDVRDAISRGIAQHVNWCARLNWRETDLHNEVKTIFCFLWPFRGTLKKVFILKRLITGN